MCLWIYIQIWEFLQSELGKSLIKGLTKHEPAHWFEQLGINIRQTVLDTDKKKVATAFLALMTIGFLRADTADLEKIGIEKEKFRTAYLARNTIYEGCIQNEDVKGLGFDTSHDFQISREKFTEYITDVLSIPTEEDNASEGESDKPWVVSIEEVIVHSPNWKKDGRGWQGSTNSCDKISFKIEDDRFWDSVKYEKINLTTEDKITVQWVYPETDEKPSKVRVLRVLNYNGIKLSDPLSSAELKIALDGDVREESMKNKAPEITLFNYNDHSEPEQLVRITE